jgi:putative two-component system response regulator
MTAKPSALVVSKKCDLEALAPMLKSTFDVTYLNRAETIAEYVHHRRPDIVVVDSCHLELVAAKRCPNERVYEDTYRDNTFAIIDDPATRSLVFEAGLSGFLLKPFERLDVITQLTRQLSLQRSRKAVRLENFRLDGDIKRQLSELTLGRKAVLECLGRAAEFKDNETGLHVVRMSKVSHEIALEYGLDSDTANLLMNAAPMHDIGKIGIPDEILLKPGKLDADEWKIMKKHSALGAAILGKANNRLLNMARTVAVAHHEKWNGSGYPRGIEKKDIPLEARIVAVADIYDALTSERPYKKAWPNHEAVELINSQSGVELDDRVVQAFNRRLPEIENISSTYADN